MEQARLAARRLREVSVRVSVRMCVAKRVAVGEGEEAEEKMKEEGPRAIANR